jgi:hypothetical protein
MLNTHSKVCSSSTGSWRKARFRKRSPDEKCQRPKKVGVRGNGYGAIEARKAMEVGRGDGIASLRLVSVPGLD